MPFDSRQHGGPDPALAPAVPVPRVRRPRPLVGGVDWGVAVLALVIAAALTAGLAWNLVSTQSQAREGLDDAIQRRAALTGDLIGSAFLAARPPAAVGKDFGGEPQSLRRALAANVVAEGQRFTVLDADGRVLATAGRGGDPSPSARRDVQLALGGTASLSDAFGDGRGGQVVELAVPYASASGRRVFLASGPIGLVQDFTKGFFATPSAFSRTHGYLLDGAGRTLSSSRPPNERLTSAVRGALARGEIVREGGRTFVSGQVPSSRWRVALSVPDTVLYASVDGAQASAAWLVFAAFVGAICALLGLGLLAARSARRLAAANRSADAAADLAHERLHDPLTGLANRELFAARAEQAVAAGRRRGRSVAVVFMDIDGFKLINDSLGHEVGDEVLREVARRLTSSVRGADTVSRLGGDEFVVLCDDLADGPAAVRAVERIRAGLKGPVDVGERSVPVTFSIGLATAGGDDERTAGALLANADAAMYRAKERGRDRVEIFDAELQRHALSRLDTEVALRRAVKDDELLLDYQPIVDLGTSQVCGVEALVRWQRPGTDVVIQPTAFIRVAEEIGMIGEIGEWVLRKATAEVGDWVARGLVGPDFVLSVNVSARQLADPEFPAQVAAAVSGWDRPADRLWLEITETAVMADPGLSDPGLEGLHALGVGLALDDFGSGYSSLGQLARTLPVSILKLDRSFVLGMDDRRDHEIVAAAAALANALELSSVAEGVESAEQALAVTGVGFRYAQGFYFGAPADADETVRRLGGGRFTSPRPSQPRAAAGS